MRNYTGGGGVVSVIIIIIAFLVFIITIHTSHHQTYLSQISQIISVEKNLSCGEISDFRKEFEQFVECYRNLCLFCSEFAWRKSLWRKIDKYEVCAESSSALCCSVADI